MILRALSIAAALGCLGIMLYASGVKSCDAGPTIEVGHVLVAGCR